MDPERDAVIRDDFAAVLAASSPADIITTTTLPTAAPDDQAEDAAAPPTESSDQLLALLSGSWAIPAAGAANGMDAAAESGATAARVPASLSAAISSAEGGAGAAASPAFLRAKITPAVDQPLATTVAAPTNDSEPATLAALAASGIAAAGRNGTRPGADGTAPVDGLNTDSFPLAATAPAPLRAPLTALGPTTVPLALPADPDAGFDDGFGSRITWMAEQRLGHAQIRLNPEHIGPIEVRVQLDGDRVSAQFSSVHAEVRQAIEASLPRLRDMLGQHGLQLGQADVGQGGTGRGEDQDSSQRGDRPNGSEDGLQPIPATFGGIRRLLDEYA